MLDKNDFTYEDDLTFENFKFHPISDESFERRRPIGPPTGGNLPPMGNYPPNFDFNPPNTPSNQSPNFNYPGGGTFNPPGMPKSPPPNYTPRKNDTGVQKMSVTGGINPQAVSGSSIRFCLYKYTYIWEESGRSYWAYLLNVSRNTVSGFRWFRNNWIYFGVDLRRIDSFVCYRADSVDSCEDCTNLKRSNTSLLSSQKEYCPNGTRDVYTKTLASIDIPDVKEDIITKTVGYIDDTEITSVIPCVKARNISYKINLEVTYPCNYDTDSKNKINELVDEAAEGAYKVLSSNRSNNDDSDPMENFNSSVTSIPEALKTFSDSFNDKLKLLDPALNASENIYYSIRSEKICNNWKPYFYNDFLY